MGNDTTSRTLAAATIDFATPTACAFCGEDAGRDVRMSVTVPRGKGGEPEELSAPSCAACRSAARTILERVQGKPISAATQPDYRTGFEMLIRGLWFHEKGSILPPDTPVSVEPIIGDAKVLLARMQPFSAFEEKSFGPQLTYWQAFSSIKPDCSLWAFRLPEDQCVLAATGDDTAFLKPESPPAAAH